MYWNQKISNLSINSTHKVRPSDAHVDNICDGLSGIALPLATANFLQGTVTINVSMADSLVFECQCVFWIFQFANGTHVTETLHLLQDLVDIWHHVLAVNHDGSVGAVPQSHVEHSAALYVSNTGKQDILSTVTLIFFSC